VSTYDLWDEIDSRFNAHKADFLALIDSFQSNTKRKLIFTLVSREVGQPIDLIENLEEKAKQYIRDLKKEDAVICSLNYLK